MAQSYRHIPTDLAFQTRLLMADVDGTLTDGSDRIIPSVQEAIRSFEDHGIAIGLVSGRTIQMLESLAYTLGISGPLIAENGGVAKLMPDAEFVDLGYSRQSAIEALEQLKAQFPNRIREREDNKDRLIDIVFWPQDIESEELVSHIGDAQLLDSGYILHLMQKGISKGRTLMRLLERIGNGILSPTEVLVVGDSTTDLSLFEMFPHSVLISNPGLPITQRIKLEKAAKYVSDRSLGEGFAEMAFHMLNALALPRHL